MRKKFIIGYKTTNILNGKFYYGIHKTYNLNDTYIGCGIYCQNDTTRRSSTSKFINAIKKYGYNNFKREIIQLFNTYNEALEWEKNTVTKEVCLLVDCYNTRTGGKHINNIFWSPERKHYHKTAGTYKKSAETRRKLSISTKKRFETRPGTFTGRKHTTDTKLKMSLLQKGKVSKNKGKRLNISPELRLRKSLQMKAKVGKLHPDYINVAIYDRIQIIDMYCNKGIGMYTIGKKFNLCESKIRKTLLESNIAIVCKKQRKQISYTEIRKIL